MISLSPSQSLTRDTQRRSFPDMAPCYASPRRGMYYHFKGNTLLILPNSKLCGKRQRPLQTTSAAYQRPPRHSGNKLLRPSVSRKMSFKDISFLTYIPNAHRYWDWTVPVVPGVTYFPDLFTSVEISIVNFNGDPISVDNPLHSYRLGPVREKFRDHEDRQSYFKVSLYCLMQAHSY